MTTTMRQAWQFEFDGETLAECCTVRRDHHAARLKYWEQAKDDAKASLESAAVVIDGDEFVGHSNYNDKFAPAPRLQVDPTASANYTRAAGKIKEHKDMMEEFERWRHLFAANPHRKFPLTPDDVSFFHVLDAVPTGV